MTILSLEEAMERGRVLAGAWQDEYPEDDWLALCDNWDINLWTDEDKDGVVKNMATIYPVSKSEEGYDETDYDKFYRVWSQPVFYESKIIRDFVDKDIKQKKGKAE